MHVIACCMQAMCEHSSYTCVNCQLSSTWLSRVRLPQFTAVGFRALLTLNNILELGSPTLAHVYLIILVHIIYKKLLNFYLLKACVDMPRTADFRELLLLIVEVSGGGVWAMTDWRTWES